MSDLTRVEKLKLEKLFGMSSGYVSNFSNRTLAEFVAESTGKDIYDAKYEYASGSKANRLRAFWDKEPNHVVAKLISDLLDYCSLIGIESGKEYLHQDCQRIASRLRSPTASQVAVASSIKESPLVVGSPRDMSQKRLVQSAVTTSEEHVHLPSTRILAVTGDERFDEFHENRLIQSAWNGPVDYLRAATLDQLACAVGSGSYAVVHLLADFAADHIRLQDGPLGIHQFRELLRLAQGKTKLLILAGCNSYAIGKEIENTGIVYSIVATSSLRTDVAETFFRLFYKRLGHDGRPDQSFSWAYSALVARYYPSGSAPLYLTTYQDALQAVHSFDQRHTTAQDRTIVLFLASNSTTTTALDLEEEVRAVEMELRSTKFRDRLSLIVRHAVRPDDLVRHIRAEKPTILHFSGHGSPQGIILRNDRGNHQVVSGTSLRRLLEGRDVSLVVLNSCFSEDQANEIAGAVKAVVGTSAEVDDEAARRFACAFYRGIGDGLTIRDAFRDGGDAVALHGLDDVFKAVGNLESRLV